MRRISSLKHLPIFSRPLKRSSRSVLLRYIHCAATPVSGSPSIAKSHRSVCSMSLSGPSFLRSQSLHSQETSGSSATECVEDSEPERMERRLREKTRKKTRTKAKPPPVVEVIELTDSDASVNHSHTIPKTNLVIGVSGVFHL